MDNLWTNINDNIPMYMSKICKEYNLVCVKISPLKTAMIGTLLFLVGATPSKDTTSENSGLLMIIPKS